MCEGSPKDIALFMSGFVSSMLATVCEGPCVNVGVENVVACGQSIDPNNILGRHLQEEQGPWMVTYDLITTAVCAAVRCVSHQDTTNANAIADRVADTVRNAVQNGSFASILSSNSDVVAALGSFVLSCLVAWGSMREATMTLIDF